MLSNIATYLLNTGSLNQMKIIELQMHVLILSLVQNNDASYNGHDPGSFGPQHLLYVYFVVLIFIKI